MKKLFLLTFCLPVFLLCAGFTNNTDGEAQKDFIRWIDFNVKSSSIAYAQKEHKKLFATGITDIGTCELLACQAITKKRPTLEGTRKLAGGRYYEYYVESYHAVLDGIIDRKTGETIGFFPLAKGYWYNHSDDFGNSRSYGYKRRHLGNDLFGGTGTPVIAVEGGIVSELGWNRYGGWRVGIRSEPARDYYDAEGGAIPNYPVRYYYYAHLRKGKPFAANLKKGDRVEAGDIIGYLGSTGYSNKEDVNMGSNPHLHFGMQIIFDKSQEDGPMELWIDVYEINKFLTRNRVRVVKDPETKEFISITTKNRKTFPKQLY